MRDYWSLAQPFLSFLKLENNRNVIKLCQWSGMGVEGGVQEMSI